MITPRPPWANPDGQAWRRWWRSVPKDECFAEELPKRGDAVSDEGAVFGALMIALRGSGFVKSNPLVGCVVRTSSGHFLAAGAHRIYGGPHAEVDALKSLTDEESRGAHVTVTLEPCAHVGKTGSCAVELARRQVARVSYLVQDPNPLVSGRGVAILRAAGAEVIHASTYQDLGEDVAEVFLHNVKSKSVFVGLKAATTLEGIYAFKGASRHWLTSERSRVYGHYLRLRYDAILVGPETVLRDQPKLNIRSPYIQGRTPVRVVLDPRGEVLARSSQLELFSDEDPLVVFTGASKTAALGGSKTILHCSVDSSGHFVWDDIKSSLGGLEICSLLIEGGGSIWKSAEDAGVVDKYHWFRAPSLDTFKGAQIFKLTAPQSEECSYHYRFGEDEYLEWPVR